MTSDIDIKTDKFIPLQVYEYPRNNSCPYVNDFISNPDLPKITKVKGCVDNFLYRMSYKFYNKYKVKGTSNLREYLALGPKISTEGFLYL